MTKHLTAGVFAFSTALGGAAMAQDQTFYFHRHRRRDRCVLPRGRRDLPPGQP